MERQEVVCLALDLKEGYSHGNGFLVENLIVTAGHNHPELEKQKFTAGAERRKANQLAIPQGQYLVALDFINFYFRDIAISTATQPSNIGKFAERVDLNQRVILSAMFEESETSWKRREIPGTITGRSKVKFYERWLLDRLRPIEEEDLAYQVNFNQKIRKGISGGHVKNENGETLGVFTAEQGDDEPIGIVYGLFDNLARKQIQEILQSRGKGNLPRSIQPLPNYFRFK